MAVVPQKVFGGRRFSLSCGLSVVLSLAVTTATCHGGGGAKLLGRCYPTHSRCGDVR